ncbi:SpaH/EbpB family LPXTG-anchored major pilin [Actinomycetaceae bacterium MB13-C1-2]|nr:SpaH/EbpB family LPXTG-anchored major pilin [Actinomycetaceae bacterium MB13-C1-2]
MTISNTKRRLAAGASALALALTGVVAASGAAFAAEVGPDQPGHPDEGSLTIVKHEGSADDAGDGTQQTINQPVLGGVEFTLWQIGVSDGAGTCTPLDLTDPDAWAKVPTTGYPTTKPAGTTDGELCTVSDTDFAPRVGTTGDNGELNFGNLPLGLYYVEETDATGAYKMVSGAQVPVSVTSEAQPFFVTMPLPADGDWLYQVYAYPKNQVTEGPKKTINEDATQAGYKVGDTVAYEISQTVPALKAGETEYSSASIWEHFSPGMQFGGLTSITINDVAVTDYTQTPATNATDEVRWSLGTTALAALKEGDVIKIAFTGKVTAVTSTGTIENPMSENPDDPGYGSEFNGTTTPTPPVDPPNPLTYWGQLKVNKVDQDGEVLSGAEFEVYPMTDTSCPHNAPATGKVASGKSDATGVVLWDNTAPASSPLGLWIANSNDGPLTDPSKDYCLYETKVPAGYTGGDVTQVTITPGTATMLDIDITNTQKDGPDLPLTGANGTLLMTIGGLGLGAIAVGVYLVTRRRQETEA